MLGSALAREADWSQCPGCGAMLYRKRLERNLKVCPDCGNHHRLTAEERVGQLFDESSVEVLDLPARSADVLGFVDSVPYPQRLSRARDATGMSEAVLVAAGTIEGSRVIAAVMDFRFLGGSLGAAVGELITLAAERALQERIPLLIVAASGGARMQEGPIALMQMAKTSQALGRLDEAGVLTISLITDPTFGGVAASFATLCDVVIAEPHARLGFAGRRVIEQTIRQQLPEDFQTAEFLLDHGLIDAIRPRSGLRGTLGRLLSMPGGAEIAAGPVDEVSAAVVRDHHDLPDRDVWEQVRAARELGRPTTLDYLARAFTDFEELRGDRLGGDCGAIVGGPARFRGVPVMVVGHQRGRTAAELPERNYGMPSPHGYRKAARLVRLAAKLGLPVITFVDTPGAHPGVEAEESGQAVAIAESIRLLAGIPVPVVAVITGEGGSGGALALAVADEVLICSNGIYSVISPEGCAAILWNDPSMAPAAAAALRVDAKQLLHLGIVDGVIPEPDGGNKADHGAAADRVSAALSGALRRLSALDAAELVARRRARFRSYGAAN
ncbi:acetyl-CoA carboxylase, carboxyltransferase subunit beta [Saccharopolyspora indica]|nr:acetyl-CoA carboxylase, carboxyltransferase subunit beta [Saccharopolyspora indica]MDA3645751.1 acetyl-CoA carboxylase, carboxyltransferase subunit beta [Saccharopolyspora indica]